MIYFDMTSCLDYMGRNPLGIVRVEMNFVKYAQSHFLKDEVTFCYYDRNLRRFVNLSQTDAKGILSSIGTSSQTSEPGSPVASEADGAAGDLRLILKSFFSHLEQILKETVKERLPRVHMLLKRFFHVKSDKLRNSFNEEVMLQPVEWTSGDVFVTAGLIWNYLPVHELFRQKRQRGFKIVGVIYDLIPYRVPECCAGVPSRFFREITDLIWSADGIGTISKLTLCDIESYCQRFQIPLPTVREVCYLGMDIGTLSADYVPKFDEIDVSKLQPGRFILQVGTIEPRKNHALSCSVWRILHREGFKDLMPLVIVGAKIGGVPDILGPSLRDEDLSDRFLIHAEHVSDMSLMWLYKNCFMTIYPSFYEGWGLPVSESLAFGKFCLAGDNAAIQEAGGRFAEYLSPYDILGWVERLREFMAHPDNVECRNEVIKREYEGLSWAESASRFMNLVERVASK